MDTSIPPENRSVDWILRRWCRKLCLLVKAFYSILTDKACSRSTNSEKSTKPPPCRYSSPVTVTMSQFVSGWQHQFSFFSINFIFGVSNHRFRFCLHSNILTRVSNGFGLLRLNQMLGGLLEFEEEEEKRSTSFWILFLSFPFFPHNAQYLFDTAIPYFCKPSL